MHTPSPGQAPQTQHQVSFGAFPNGGYVPQQHHQMLQMRAASLPPLPSNFIQPPLLQSQLSGSNENFKVVIRVRPPLPREQKDDVEFRGIVNVSQDSKSCAIMEYLGAEVGEYERQRDMDANPHLCVWQSFTFDHVYD